MKKIIAVIPAYNEELHIKEVIKETKKYVDEVMKVSKPMLEDFYRQPRQTKIFCREIHAA